MTVTYLGVKRRQPNFIDDFITDATDPKTLILLISMAEARALAREIILLRRYGWLLGLVRAIGLIRVKPIPSLQAAE